MVKRDLELDDSLFEDRPRRRKGAKERAPKDRTPKEHSPRVSRVDNVLAVAIVLAIIILVVLGLTAGKENWFAVVLIGLIFLASELFALPMKPAGRLSIALFALVMAMMISGPLGTAVVALFGIPIFFMEMEPQGWRRLAFNTSQMVFAAGAAGLVFKYTGGALLDATLKSGAKDILPWLLATLVFFVINSLLVMPVLAGEGQRMLRFWVRRLLPKLPGYIIYSGLGFIAAVIYVKLEFPAVVLLFVPILAIRVVYTRYGTMRDVCDDTTLAIMEAVESGQMFMEGHSIGVADIAVAIAEEMDFEEEDIHFLRQGALLHDIGKLALDPSIINKEGTLTPEEYDEIKTHPLIGASIVQGEPTFSIVAPTIRHHHEMTDGSGYPDGLAGETIPLGARILSVADAFDAMQRPIGYRDTKSAYNAASEVIRGKGIQFDPDVVDAFTKVVIKREIWTGSLKEKLRRPAGSEAPQTQLTPEQPSLEEPPGGTEADETPPRPPGSTPGGGISYDDVRGEIEQDIRDWKRADIGQRRVREQKRKTGSRRKKGEEDKG